MPMGVAVAVGLVMSLTGAFGTGVADLAPRTLYWIAVMCLGTLIAVAARPLVERTGWFDGRMWAEAAVVSLVIITFGAPSVWLVTHLTFGSLVASATPDLFIGPVTVLSIAMTALNYGLQRPAPMTHGSAGDPSQPALRPPRFADRLPPNLRGAEIRAVAAEDHYLRVHTDRGQTLILMRLADAVAELEGIEGAQTHRSWWVARAAVTDARRGEGRATLILEGGLTAPVSRTFARSLRDAGWF